MSLCNVAAWKTAWYAEHNMPDAGAVSYRADAVVNGRAMMSRPSTSCLKSVKERTSASPGDLNFPVTKTFMLA